MGRERKRYPWELLMGKKLWMATELYETMQISPLNTRRYLRRSFHAGRLIRKKFGRIYYFGIKLFSLPPKDISQCDLSPECSGEQEHFVGGCGCEFFLCVTNKTVNPSHSIYHWCSKHGELIPPSQSSSHLDAPEEVT